MRTHPHCPTCGQLAPVPCPTCGHWPHEPCLSTDYDDLVHLGLSRPAAFTARAVEELLELALAPFALIGMVAFMNGWLYSNRGRRRD